MRRILPFAQPLFLVGCALAVLLPAESPWLARAAVSVFLFGYSVRCASVDRAWVPLRHRLGVSEATGLSVAMMFYAAAGVPAIAGAVLYLPPAGAAMFSVFIIAWSAGWLWVLRRIWHPSPAGQVGSRVRPDRFIP